MAFLAKNSFTSTNSTELNSDETYHETEDTSIDDIVCSICHEANPNKKLITCDNCQNIFHLHCVNLKNIPCSWTCNSCCTKFNDNNKNCCSICNNKEFCLCSDCISLQKKIERKNKNINFMFCTMCDKIIKHSYWQCTYCKIKYHHSCVIHNKNIASKSVCAECGLFLKYRNLKLFKHFEK